MRPRDIALAVALMAAWGINFVAIDIGLDRMPPLLFSALRFALAALPAIFFVGRPFSMLVPIFGMASATLFLERRCTRPIWRRPPS